MELFDRSGKPIRHARDIRYDNLVSGLSATDLQAAIDELAAGSASYTDEDAQDAVGNILTNSATIEFTYDDSTPSITADLSAEVLNLLDLADSAVQPGDLAAVAFSGDYVDLINTPSIPSAANPSASVGLSAVNGSADTFMRSDAAPALDQAISPTWTGAHTFTQPVSFPDGAVGSPSVLLTDVGLYRLGEGVLSVSCDGTEVLRVRNQAVVRGVQIIGAMQLGVLSPPQLTADQNDYEPSGVETAGVLRLSSNASRSITGIFTANLIGRVLMIQNVGANNIVLVNESVNSTAEYRFAVGSDITIGPNGGVTLCYDATIRRWRCVGRH